MGYDFEEQRRIEQNATDIRYFDYAHRYVEVYIDKNEYVQFDHCANKELIRRTATEEEKKTFYNRLNAIPRL